MGSCGWWGWNNGWLWLAGMKLWLVVGGGIKIMAGCSELLPGRGWWQQNYGWSWVVAQFSNPQKKDWLRFSLEEMYNFHKMEPSINQIFVKFYCYVCTNSFVCLEGSEFVLIQGCQHLFRLNFKVFKVFNIDFEFSCSCSGVFSQYL